MMTVDRPLISVLDVGESSSLIPRGDVAANYTFASDDPGIVIATPEGIAHAVATGSTIVHITRVGDEASRLSLPLAVMEPISQQAVYRAGHPRLRFTPDELVSRRALLTNATSGGLAIDIPTALAEFIELADRFAAEPTLEIVYSITDETFSYNLPYPLAQPTPLPQPYGFTDYPFWTRLSREIEQRLITLSLAWSLTEEERYAKRGIETLLAISRWSKWHEYDKATNNLSLPHFTIGAAIAFDEFHALLSDGERATVRDAILNLGLRAMGYWIGQRLDHNIMVLMDAGMVIGALAIGGEVPFVDKYLAEPLDALRWYLKQREESEMTEGLVYTNYASGTIFRAASAVRRVTGDDSLLQSSFAREVLPDLFLYLRGGAGGFANLADARYHESDPGELMLQHLNEYGDPRAAWLVQRTKVAGSALIPWLQQDFPSQDIDISGLPHSRRFDRFDWVALRTGFGDDDTLIAFTSSPSKAGHNHFDQNNFILNMGGDWLITDPGYQNYTPGPEAFFTNATLGHNSLLVNDDGQRVRGHGRIISAELGETIDYVIGDATAAYEGRLRRWHRHLLFVKPDYALLVDDVIPTSIDDRITLLFHTTWGFSVNGAPLPLGANIEDARNLTVTVTGSHASVRLQFAADTPLQVRHDQYPGAERFGSYLRVELPQGERHLIATLMRLSSGSDHEHFAFQSTITGTDVEIGHVRGDDIVHIAAGTDSIPVAIEYRRLAPRPE